MGKNKNLTPEEKEYIKVNMLIKSVGAIAEELGRNYYTIYRYIDRTFGVERQKKFTPEEDKQFIKMYKQKIRVKEIAKYFGTDENAIYNHAKALGIQKQVHVRRT